MLDGTLLMRKPNGYDSLVDRCALACQRDECFLQVLLKRLPARGRSNTKGFVQAFPVARPVLVR